MGTADLKTPERCIMSRPRFAAYSYMIKESCQGIPSQDLAKYQQETTTCVKQEVIPTNLGQDTFNLSVETMIFEDDEMESSYLSGGKKSGIIFLHGLGTPESLNRMVKFVTGPALGLAGKSRNKIVAPMAPKEPVAMIPPTMVPGLRFVNSWFNFWALPGISVVSPVATESKAGLEKAMDSVEAEIHKMIAAGIPSENIVVSGASQGGALTLYTALHTKYKIGGFFALVAWQPLLKIEPPSQMPVPANKDTPILHMNGLMDPIVPVICGRRTSQEFETVFTQYKLSTVPGTHTTSLNPTTIPK